LSSGNFCGHYVNLNRRQEGWHRPALSLFISTTKPETS
jgi:hypothetical protein